MKLLGQLRTPIPAMTVLVVVDRAIYGKLLQLLKEAAPRISRVAVLHRASPAGSPSSTPFEAMGPAAERLRVKLLPAVVDREDQIAAAFAAIGLSAPTPSSWRPTCPTWPTDGASYSSRQRAGCRRRSGPGNSRTRAVS